MTRLEILSDPVCPWCYIGKGKLEIALAEAGNPFEIIWLPFQLNPDMAAEGMDRTDYMAGKFGKERIAELNAQVEAAAHGAGLPMDLGKITRSPNTLDAHRLIHWAVTSGHQTAVVAELFDRYFVQGQDISEHAVLIEVAAAVGMDVEVVTRLLASDTDKAEVSQAAATGREMGISGVPTFVIGGKYAVQGAQDAGTWTKIITDINEATAKLNG